MKKSICIFCALLLAVSLLGCNQKENNPATEQDSANTTTRQGRIMAIEGDTVTLTLMEEMQDGQPDAIAPEKPDGQQDGNNNGQPPELPQSGAGEAPAGQGEGQQPPELPDSQNPSDMGNEPPQMPEGQGDMNGMNPMNQMGGEGETLSLNLKNVPLTRNGESISLDALAVGDMLTVTLDAEGNPVSAEVLGMGQMELPGGMGGGQPGGFGGSGQVEQGTSANTISTDSTIADGAYTSTGDDENALRIDGATVTLTGITVDKASGASSNAETGDFYGMNAALLATNGAQVTIDNADVSSSAQNGNGIFSYGSGTVVTVKDTTITTTKDNSGGIQTTGGGTTYAENLLITTAGNSSAAIRSDRGGGTVRVTGGTYTTNGYNSPAVYSTADISVTNALLTATASEALVIEGKNSIALTDCQVSGSMDGTHSTSGDENVHAVMIYQSMSGDAEVGTSQFTMTGGSLTGNAGDLFFVTNTHCLMTLQGVELVNTDATGALLRISGNSATRGWGKAGSNGAQVEATCVAQILNGDILVDSISTLSLTLQQGSVFTGSIQIYDNQWGGTALGDNISLTIEEGCTWSLTGNSTLTTLTNHGTILYNGFTVTLGDGTVLGE